MAKKRPSRKGQRLKPADKLKDERLDIKIEAMRKRRYERAADSADVPLSLWVRQACDAACKAQGIE